MMKFRKINKWILRPGVRWFFFALAALLAAVGGYGGFQSAALKAQIEEETLYSYYVSADSSYTAYLIPNELYTEKSLPEGGLYANSLVDYFEMVFDAQYTGDMGISVDSSYTIEAVVQGYQSAGANRQVIYERRFPLIGQTKESGDGNVSISRKVSISLQPYIEFVNKAEQILGARPQRELLILFTGHFEAESNNEKVLAPFSHTVTMPLTGELFTVTKQKPYSERDSITRTVEYMTPASSAYAAPWIILVLAGLVLAIAILLLTRKPTAKEQSRMDMKEMLRKHGSRMVRLSARPKLFAENPQTAVSALEDLLKISDDIQRPICYFPGADGLPAEGLLYVTDGGRHYTLRSKS